MSAFSEHSPPLISSGGAHSKVPWKLVIMVDSLIRILDRPTSCKMILMLGWSTLPGAS